MQLQDKLIEDRDAAHAESQQREELREHGEDQLPEPVTEAVQDEAMERSEQLLGVIRMILDRQPLEIGQLRLPPRETKALEALQSAVEGKHAELGNFLYASDRRDLLEGALAVLQPDLTHTDDRTARELHAQLADLTERVAELRESLSSLEEAQDEILEEAQKAALLAAAAGPPKPKPPPKPSDPDAPRPPTTLTGPDLPATPPAATTLTGPDRREAPTPPSTLTGPDLREAPRPPTTLTGPDLPEPRPAPTTLTGADLPEEPPPASTLGADAPADDDGKAKKPWWRRPFG